MNTRTARDLSIGKVVPVALTLRQHSTLSDVETLSLSSRFTRGEFSLWHPLRGVNADASSN
jgi:hypothetical protein